MDGREEKSRTRGEEEERRKRKKSGKRMRDHVRGEGAQAVTLSNFIPFYSLLYYIFIYYTLQRINYGYR